MPRNHLAMFKNVSSPQDAVKCLTQILFKKAADIRACADADLKVDMARQCYPERDSHLQGETYEAEDFPVAHSVVRSVHDCADGKHEERDMRIAALRSFMIDGEYGPLTGVILILVVAWGSLQMKHLKVIQQDDGPGFTVQIREGWTCPTFSLERLTLLATHVRSEPCPGCPHDCTHVYF